jgi:isopenicillin-N N-acyltransferase-like protein
MSVYTDLFQQTCAMSWDVVREVATKYIEPLQGLCPRYVEEMKGVAAGAGVELADVVALNVRTEIMFGLFTTKPDTPIKLDGCTSIGFWNDTTKQSILAQNWDWMVEQAPNLFICHISQPGSNVPDIAMCTEGGVIGKIGFNANGVGVCLNAIRARGVDQQKLPIHLALRTVLESASREEAIASLKRLGTAGSGHMLIADSLGSTGVECTIKGLRVIDMNKDSMVTHSNHLLLEHEETDQPHWLVDSVPRLARFEQLISQAKSKAPDHDLDETSLYSIFTDEQGYPASINRCQSDGGEAQTLFTIIMNLSEKRATVTFGRPAASSERVLLTV